MSTINNVMRCMPLFHNGLQVDEKCTNMTLDFGMLKIIFPLHTKMRSYHLKYPIFNFVFAYVSL